MASQQGKQQDGALPLPLSLRERGWTSFTDPGPLEDSFHHPLTSCLPITETGKATVLPLHFRLPDGEMSKADCV